MRRAIRVTGMLILWIQILDIQAQVPGKFRKPLKSEESRWEVLNADFSRFNDPREARRFGRLVQYGGVYLGAASFGLKFEAGNHPSFGLDYFNPYYDYINSYWTLGFGWVPKITLVETPDFSTSYRGHFWGAIGAETEGSELGEFLNRSSEFVLAQRLAEPLWVEVSMAKGRNSFTNDVYDFSFDTRQWRVSLVPTKGTREAGSGVSLGFSRNHFAYAGEDAPGLGAPVFHGIHAVINTINARKKFVQSTWMIDVYPSRVGLNSRRMHAEPEFADMRYVTSGGAIVTYIWTMGTLPHFREMHHRHRVAEPDAKSRFSARSNRLGLVYDLGFVASLRSEGDWFDPQVAGDSYFSTIPKASQGLGLLYDIHLQRVLPNLRFQAGPRLRFGEGMMLVRNQFAGDASEFLEVDVEFWSLGLPFAFNVEKQVAAGTWLIGGAGLERRVFGKDWEFESMDWIRENTGFFSPTFTTPETAVWEWSLQAGTMHSVAKRGSEKALKIQTLLIVRGTRSEFNVGDVGVRPLQLTLSNRFLI